MFRHSYGYYDSDVDSDSYVDSILDSDFSNGIESIYRYSGWDSVSCKDGYDLEDKIEKMGGISIFSRFEGSFDFQIFLGDIYELYMYLSFNLYINGYSLLDIKTIDLLDVNVNKKLLYFGCKVKDCDSSCKRVFSSDLLKKLFKYADEVDCQSAKVVSVSFKRDMLILEVSVFGV